ncbi:MAG: hypothetical protein KAR79_02285 [Simkaniaceae bacterium]|nr:hypothetical protein [Simkaniaceae bacterium]
MSGITSPTPFFNNSWSESHQKKDLLPNNFNKNTSLYPIDESEEFLDPYSDLNLYLSKKIKKEIQTYGSSKKWSHQIQADLLSKLLPEFKEHFPKYRLGGSALRKIWEKVSYFYSKVQIQNGATKEDGNLNIDFMIKENLKHVPLQKPLSNLPPYTSAHQLATRMSECIATLDGIKPDLDQLTKVIWAANKHILPNLNPVTAKSPYEEYDKYDKIIIKTLLEITATHKNIPAHVLEKEIQERINTLSEVAEYGVTYQLTTILSIILANKQFTKSPLHTYFCSKEKQAVESFIQRQIDLCSNRSTLSFDSNNLDLVQRILTVYPIACDLPKNILVDRLIEGIRYIYHLSIKKPLDRCPVLPRNLYIFIQAELHTLKGKYINISLKQLEKEIIKSYQFSLSLPNLQIHELDQLEMLIWKIMEKKQQLLKLLPSKHLIAIENELENHIIDHGNLSFNHMVTTCLHSLKKLHKTSLHKTEIKKKIQIWTIQNDMLCRWIHFNQKTPILKLIHEEWNRTSMQESNLNHEKFVETIINKYLQTRPDLKKQREQLTKRAFILYKYFWYHDLSKSSESSYNRFLKWHLAEGKTRNELRILSSQILPLTPFQENE